MKFSNHLIFRAVLLIGLFAASTAANAQSNVGIGTAIPDSSAILELNAVDKGLLMTRVTSAQRLAIVNPATGLLVYDTDVQVFYYWDGTQWVMAIGPQGPTGPQGPAGATGLQGVTGPTGDQGIPGITGPTGPEGAQGVTGATGLQGADGAPGITGTQGVPGPSGPTGPSGPVGCSLPNYVIRSTGTGATCTSAPIYDNAGYVGIGNTSPLAKLHISAGGLLCTGTTGNTPLSGMGTRFMYIPAKGGALRAGYVWDYIWDNAEIGISSVALGEQTWAKGYASTAMGYFSKALGNYSVAAGYNTNAEAESSVSLGHGNRNAPTAPNSVTLGTRNVVTAQYGIAIGDSCRVSGLHGVAIGDTARATGFKSVSIGTATRATNLNSVALGLKTLASGISSFATGFFTTASGGQSFAANDNTIASGYASVALNQQTVASGERSMAIGQQTSATQLNALATGNSTIAAAENSITGGFNSQAVAYASVVFGRYNTLPASNPSAWVNNQQLFVLGNGTGPGARSNAMEVYKDGDVTIAGNLFQNSDSLLKMNIAPLTGVLDKIRKIQPVYFEFKNTETHPQGRQIGFIAQELEVDFPELTKTNSSGNLSVAYGNVTAVLLQAIKELKAENDALRSRLDKLEQK
jgi:hypothetical protein